MNITTKYQYIDEEGNIANTLPTWATAEKLIEFYKTLVLIRQYDKKAIALQRTGQLGTYAPCLGQEAISLGIGFAMDKTDVMAAYYRDQGAQYLRGYSLASQLRYWGGDERGSSTQDAVFSEQDLPNCIPIANQITHAAGIASAIKIRRERRAVVATCGEGATSRGDFYESLNLAGVWQLPLVVVVNNNHWAISTPSTLQTQTPHIAQKSTAAGIQGITVDGNDIVAMYNAVQEALLKARQGKGATLIEAESYRLCDHTTADDATRYRNSDEVNAAWKKDPIKRLQNYLFQRSLWSPEKEQQLIENNQQFIDSEVAAYLATEPSNAADCFDHLYEELPYALQEQRKHFVEKSINSSHAGG
ncbi:pyruvate dehydrogenase (acetyl-transferring) E1 component subunit alpha [Gammaproteobacteria bacterium 42_54_T18]|nr:pyruvate dehydrogenase (acetyl-transferring) E1 component subunit alpha [Gammaproteobacteria bacterium 42_54_T18]